MLEFSKWEQQNKQDATSFWVDVFGIAWICFGCYGLVTKHVPFCHNSRSFSKWENDHFQSANLNLSVAKFISHEELVALSNDEVKY